MSECFPQGHFYSVMPDKADMTKHYEKINELRMIENVRDDSLNGIKLNLSNQKELVEHLENNYADDLESYVKSNAASKRFPPNGMYSCMDAGFLYYMMRDLKPNNIIEIGCGFSSALMMDVNELYFDNLNMLLKVDDFKSDKITALKMKTQELDINLFNKLERDDILFLDTTHVTKAGSDVNFLLFEVLPTLKSGVHIHFHDIFYPFETPEIWINNGYYWNENFILRAFLQNNDQYKIKIFSDLAINICKFNKRTILYHPYGIGTQYGGASLWLEKQ